MEEVAGVEVRVQVDQGGPFAGRAGRVVGAVPGRLLPKPYPVSGVVEGFLDNDVFTVFIEYSMLLHPGHL